MFVVKFVFFSCLEIYCMRFSVLLYLFIPALLALSHDVFLFVSSYVLGPEAEAVSVAMLKERFHLSSFGFIWTEYGEGSYRETVRSMNPETWKTIDGYLTYTAFYTFVVAGVVLSVLCVVLGFIGVGPCRNKDKKYDKQTKERLSFRAGGQSKKMNYKRK